LLHGDKSKNFYHALFPSAYFKNKKEQKTKTTTTPETHVYLEVCSWGYHRKAFEPKNN
jgi:hypothetical protein